LDNQHSWFQGCALCSIPRRAVAQVYIVVIKDRDVVFDPFIGSGTTAVMARRLGRHFLGCDLNSEYVKLATERLRGVSN